MSSFEPSAVVADSSPLLRAGLTVLLSRGGYQVVAEAAAADELVQVSTGTVPAVVVTDARLGDGFHDEGVTAALRLHEKLPDVGVLVLGDTVETAYAARVFGSGGTGGLGYLLKDRVRSLPHFLDAVGRVAAGEVVVDPTVVRSIVTVPHHPDALRTLTLHETTVLEMMCAGLPDSTIAGRLFISEGRLLEDIATVFLKLGLPPEVEDRRRPAILTHLRPAS